MKPCVSKVATCRWVPAAPGEFVTTFWFTVNLKDLWTVNFHKLISWGACELLFCPKKWSSPKHQMGNATNCFVYRPFSNVQLYHWGGGRGLATYFDLGLRGHAMIKLFTWRTIYHRTLPTDPSWPLIDDPAPSWSGGGNGQSQLKRCPMYPHCYNETEKENQDME